MLPKGTPAARVMFLPTTVAAFLVCLAALVDSSSPGGDEEAPEAYRLPAYLLLNPDLGNWRFEEDDRDDYGDNGQDENPEASLETFIDDDWVASEEYNKDDSMELIAKDSDAPPDASPLTTSQVGSTRTYSLRRRAQASKQKDPKVASESDEDGDEDEDGSAKSKSNTSARKAFNAGCGALKALIGSPRGRATLLKKALSILEEMNDHIIRLGVSEGSPHPLRLDFEEKEVRPFKSHQIDQPERSRSRLAIRRVKDRERNRDIHDQTERLRLTLDLDAETRPQDTLQVALSALRDLDTYLLKVDKPNYESLLSDYVVGKKRKADEDDKGGKRQKT